MKDQSTYLAHILEAIRDIKDYATPGRDVFLSDRMRQDAIIRKIEIIGEAVKNLADDIKELAPHTPWRNIAGMRDRLTHNYFGVDLDLVWVVVERELPKLEETITALAARSPRRSGTD